MKKAERNGFFGIQIILYSNVGILLNVLVQLSVSCFLRFPERRIKNAKEVKKRFQAHKST